MPSLTDIIKDIDLTKVEHINTISGLASVDPNSVSAVFVAMYHDITTLKGGGLFVPRTGRHDGGDFIDLSRPFPSDWNDSAQLAAWFADSGVDVFGFKRVKPSSEVNVCEFGAKADFNESDNTGLDGTNDYYAFQKCLDTGFDVFAPRGAYRIGSKLVMSTDSQTLRGEGWFSTRLYGTQSEGNVPTIETANENITLRHLGIFNGLNVGLPTDRINIGLNQASNGNLGLDNVYITGFGYGCKIQNYFADRLVVENTKQIAIWDNGGRKSKLLRTTLAGNRISIQLGDGTNNTQCQDKSYSDIVIEHGTNSTWESELVPAINIVGKAAHTEWTNLTIVKPYGSAIAIDNEYDNNGTPTLSESNHAFTNVTIRNNRTTTIAKSAVDITNSENVHFVNLRTKQPTIAGQGWLSAINVGLSSFVRVANSAIGGSGMSIGDNSITGSPVRASLSNTSYNYNANLCGEDGHIEDLGNKAGNVNLTIDWGKTKKITLTADVVFTTVVNNQSESDLLTLILIQDSTGGRTPTFESSKWATSVSDSGTANQIQTVTFRYDSSLSKFIEISSTGWM